MPTILHESTGLKIVRNDVNRFVIATLHYTADPVKRSKEWQAEARAGFSPAQWAKEYEIDYTALYGQRVFPEMQQNKSKIVIPEPYKEYSALTPFWAGFDFGSRNPSAFIVFTIEEGVTVAVWELYEPCKNIPDLTGKIMSCPYYHQLKYIVCDPTITNQKSRTNRFGDLVPLAEIFHDHGIRKPMVPGHTEEGVWVEMMRKAWKDPADPTFMIRACCPNLVRELENAVYASQSDKELLTQTYREELEDVHNHAMDATKYFFLSRPTTRNIHHKQPEQWRRWMK